jgi:hypothetical protein
MVKLKVKHWQDPVTLVLGLWMLVSPWILRYEAEKSLMWSGVVLGTLITLTALVGLFKAAESAEWTNAVLGLCGVVSPWIPAVSSMVATANAVIVGISVGGLALWALSSEEPVRGSRRQVSNLPTDVLCHRRRNRAATSSPPFCSLEEFPPNSRVTGATLRRLGSGVRSRRTSTS